MRRVSLTLQRACSWRRSRSGGEQRAIPFWPDEVPAAIHAEIDGNATLETVRELGRFHRVHGSPGYAAAAEHLRQKLLAAGLSTSRSSVFPPTARRATRTSSATTAGRRSPRPSKRSRRSAGLDRVLSRAAGGAGRLQPGRGRDGRAGRRRRRRLREGLRRKGRPRAGSCSPTATRPPSTKPAAKSAGPPGSCRTFPTRRPPGRATIGTSCAGDTSRPTRPPTASPSCSRSGRRRRTARAWRRARRSCCARASRRRWFRPPTTSSWRRSRGPIRPPARSS